MDEIVTAEIDGEQRVWELTYGKWNKVKSPDSGNPYWRDDSVALDQGEEVVAQATVFAKSDGGLSYFDDREHFVRFIEYYMRGKIIPVESLS
jgi:hypothetical protein